MAELGWTLLLAAHLLCMSVASAGPLICIWLDWRWRTGDGAAGWAVQFLSRKSLALLLVGSLLGLVVGYGQWDDQYRQLLRLFEYKLRWGVWELLFSLVLMAWHAWLVGRPPARGWSFWFLRGANPLLASTNLLYHFPPLFVVMAGVAAGTLERPEVVDAASFRSLMGQSFVWAKTLHIWLASLTVTGVTLLAYGGWLLRQGDAAEAGRRIAVWGARLALGPTLLQMLAGFWLLSVVPGAVQRRLLGGDWLAAATLAGSVVASLWLMHHLAAISFGEISPRSRRLALALMLAVVILMTSSSRLASSRLPTLSQGNAIATEVQLVP